MEAAVSLEFPSGDSGGGTQEVELSGGQWPLDTPGQDACVRVCVCASWRLDGCLPPMCYNFSTLHSSAAPQLIYLLSGPHNHGRLQNLAGPNAFG